MNGNIKSNVNAKQAFREKANSKLQHLPQQARDKCENIDRHAIKVKQKWQARQGRRFNTEVARHISKQQKTDGHALSPSPRGMKDSHALSMAKARAAVSKRNEGQMASLENTRKDRQNTVARKHGVTLHPEARRAQVQKQLKKPGTAKQHFISAGKRGNAKTSFNRAAKGLSR